MELKIEFNELDTSERNGTLKKSDFTRMLTNAVLLPIGRIEYILRN